MTLIDSIYVNNGGAKILLEFLLKEIIGRTGFQVAKDKKCMHVKDLIKRKFSLLYKLVF